MEENDLTKALNELSNLVKSQSPEEQKNALLQKSMDGTATEEDEAALAALLQKSDADADGEGLPGAVLDSLEASQTEEFQKSLNVSSFLQSQHEGNVEALTTVAETVQKSMNQAQGFNLALARVVASIGERVEEMAKSIESATSRPGQPKSVQSAPQAKALQKSFAGAPPAEGQKLSKSQVLDALEQMHEASYKTDHPGATQGGEGFDLVISKYESTNQMSKATQAELKDFLSR